MIREKTHGIIGSTLSSVAARTLSPSPSYLAHPWPIALVPVHKHAGTDGAIPFLHNGEASQYMCDGAGEYRFHQHSPPERTRRRREERE
jgi:hypothetical protein